MDKVILNLSKASLRSVNNYLALTQVMDLFSLQNKVNNGCREFAFIQN